MVMRDQHGTQSAERVGIHQWITHHAKNQHSKEEEWLAAHNQIVSALGSMVEASLQCELESIKDATIAWKLLKEKTHSKGLISKL